jgi:polyhydroxyalkanoate synthesis regulator phasin
MVRREDIRAMQDAWRAYLDLALGLTETSRKKATKVARKLVGRGNATAEQLQAMAEDLVSTSLANREALVRLVRFELERGLGRVGLATVEEVNALTVRVRELEEQLEAARDGRGAVEPAAPVKAVPVKAVPVTKAAPVTKAPAKTVAKKTVAKKAVAKKTATPVVPEVTAVVAAVADEPTPAPASRPTVARKAPTKRAPAKTVAKRAVAKKAPAPVGEQ